MILKEILMRLERSQTLYNDLVNSIDESYLSQKLKDLLSNTIGQQLWCVIGARASYLKAVKALEWSGFECPLKWENTISKSKVLEELNNTFESTKSYLQEAGSLEDKQVSLLLDLIEHEVQHHGQLARYIYGHKLKMPESWKKRYNFD